MSNDLPKIEIEVDQCKGCQLCLQECPKKVIVVSQKFNKLGYQYAEYSGSGCIGCGMCFYACPEPGAITVYKKQGENYAQGINKRKRSCC